MKRQPKALRYTAELAAVERRIVDALPEAKAAPSDDRQPPYSKEDQEIERQSNESDRDMRRMLA